MVIKEQEVGVRRGRRPKYSDPRSRTITFEAAVLEQLDELARAERQSAADLVGRAVEAFLNPQNITLMLEPQLKDQLEAISRADPNGRLSETEMATQAIVEYATTRCAKPEVQQILASMSGGGLRLVTQGRRVAEGERPTNA
jgi:predicted transcriptional regulator